MATEVSVRDREQLHYLLSEAAEIEHDLMCCYLYAAFSMKDARDDLQPDELEATQRWRRSITSVAIEEMTHLSLVSNLLTSIGGTPHFGRQNFPTSPGVHPAGIVLQLAALDRATLDHFIFLERPEGMDLPDGAGFAPTLAYVRGPRRPGLMPMALDFATVGALYAAIRTGFTTLTEKLGERALFVGDPAAQVGPELLSLPGMRRVTDLASAHAALETIVQQGEGAPGHTEDSHFRKFVDIRTELDALVGARASFAPARPAARNPVMRRPPMPEGRVWITAPVAEEVVDLANSAYTFSLRLLAQGFGWAGEVEAKRTLLDAAIASMQAVGVLGSELTRMPASPDHPGVTAGMTFALLRTIAPLPHGGSEWTFLRERAQQLAGACQAATASTPELSRCTRVFEEVARELSRVELAPPAPTSRSLPVVREPAVAAPTPSQHDGAVEIVESEGVTLQFEARRCIHARHCVLGEPEVFVANVVGPWAPSRAHAGRGSDARRDRLSERRDHARAQRRRPRGSTAQGQRAPRSGERPVRSARRARDRRRAASAARDAVSLWQEPKEAVLRRLARRWFRGERRARDARRDPALGSTWPAPSASAAERPARRAGQRGDLRRHRTKRAQDHGRQALPLRRLGPEAALRRHPCTHRLPLGHVSLGKKGTVLDSSISGRSPFRRDARWPQRPSPLVGLAAKRDRSHCPGIAPRGDRRP